LLLLVVFTIVNIAVLVLRKEKVDHKHFTAPTIVPVLGAITCAFLASPFSGRPGADYRIALYLLGAGVVLWVINYFVHGKVEEFDPEKLAK
jgi:amino acid transporter